jgi:hypothetical protein
MMHAKTLAVRLPARVASTFCGKRVCGWLGWFLPGLCVFGAYNGLRWTTFQQTASAAFQKSADERLAAYRENCGGAGTEAGPRP